MDPAGPGWGSTDPLVGLDKDDAAFVDTINTDSVSGSTPRGRGDLNWFPHEGSGQPGCRKFHKVL